MQIFRVAVPPRAQGAVGHGRAFTPGTEFSAPETSLETTSTRIGPKLPTPENGPNNRASVVHRHLDATLGVEK